MGDAQAIIANLPPWMQVVANVALLVIVLATMGAGVWHGLRKKADDTDDHHDAALILAADPVKAGLSALVEIGANARLQTEALKTMAAAHTAYAKLVEPDFLELRIFKAVQEQLREERRARGA